MPRGAIRPPDVWRRGFESIALWGRFGFASHHRPAYRVHYGDIGAQESHILDLPYEARPLHPLVEELLVKWGDLLTPFEVRTVERHKISVFRKYGGESFATTPVPAVHQLLVQVVDSCLVGGVRGFVVIRLDSH